MSGKESGKKNASRKVNVEIAPGNQRRLDAYIEGYNTRPDRRTPKLKYTDVVNAALDWFLEGQLPKLRERLATGEKERGNGQEAG